MGKRGTNAGRMSKRQDGHLLEGRIALIQEKRTRYNVAMPYTMRTLSVGERGLSVVSPVDLALRRMVMATSRFMPSC
jgi:hypothetical protein